MLVVLAFPMVRECCLPVTRALPCHETKHTVDLTCYSNQQVIETKLALGLGSSGPYETPIAPEKVFAFGLDNRKISTTSVFDLTSPSDIYLRTGALLI